MTYLEIIEELKNSVIEVAMAEITTMASTIMGMCLYRYEKKYCTDDDILKKKNPFGQKNPFTSEMNEFQSYYDGIITALRDDFLINTINTNELSILINGWSLRTLDLEFFKTYDKNIINMNDELKIPFIDQYTIRNGTNIVLETSSKEEATKLQKEHPGYIVTNSKGNIVNLNPINILPEKIVLSTNDIYAGAKIICKNIPMYDTSLSKVPSRFLNKTCYIYDGVNVNGRYRICLKTSEDVIIPMGYIRESDILK